MFVAYFFPDKNQTLQLCGWRAYCDVCGTEIALRAIEDVSIITTWRLPSGREGRKVSKVLTLDVQTQFFGWIDELRDEGHAIPHGAISTTGSKYRRPDYQVNCVCRDCIEKYFSRWVDI